MPNCEVFGRFRNLIAACRILRSWPKHPCLCYLLCKCREEGPNLIVDRIGAGFCCCCCCFLMGVFLVVFCDRLNHFHKFCNDSVILKRENIVTFLVSEHKLTTSLVILKQYKFPTSYKNSKNVSYMMIILYSIIPPRLLPT